MRQRKNPILFTEEQWRNSQLSIARFYGGVTINSAEYVILNKDGKDIFECSKEAELLGQNEAIPAGEPADLVNVRFKREYRKLGREKFLEKYNIKI